MAHHIAQHLILRTISYHGTSTYYGHVSVCLLLLACTHKYHCRYAAGCNTGACRHRHQEQAQRGPCPMSLPPCPCPPGCSMSPLSRVSQCTPSPCQAREALQAAKEEFYFSYNTTVSPLCSPLLCGPFMPQPSSRHSEPFMPQPFIGPS